MESVLRILRQISTGSIESAARLVDPLRRLWNSEPVLLIAGLLIAAKTGADAAGSGLDTGLAIEATIEALVAFLIRARVWAPETVARLGQTED